mmetsp:Transcript_32808/g.64633  ORF Transcript_32808/g.64633 Transcript_32808/m.64633 type:complete len:447 (+) Transcript_32808:125-1465(+)
MAATSTPTENIQQSSMPVEEADVAESNAADLERQPLLDKPKEEPQKWGWWPFSGGGDGKSPRKNYFGNFFSGSKAKKTEDPIDDEWDSTQYDITRITSWSAFGMVKGCAWDNHSLWRCMGLALLLSVAVALGAFFMPHAVLVKPEKLEKLGTFLNVFVGLLLGFFLASSMNRWYGCVNAFLELLDAVRSMQMQMTALGVRKDRADTIGRYGVMSAWLLHFHLTLDSEDGQGDVDLKDMWKKLDMVRPSICLPKEKVMLSQYPEPYALLWTWVASLVGRMAVDSEIPAMASPTYGRILDLVSNAFSSIREVRALYAVKVPFIYLHTLAVLVHVNNILNAVSFGLTLGSAFTQSVEIEDEEVEPIRMSSRRRVKVWTMLCMQFCFSMIAPMLYLALLEVCVCISQPFRYKDARIPAVRLIRALEEDLKNAAAVADRPPDWEKPMFKVP